MAHSNSGESLKRTNKAERYRMILDALEREQKPMSDRQIQKYLGLPERNSVSPRITELINEHKKLREVGRVWDSATKRHVRTVMLVNGRLF
jgi:hypothetical protein